MKQGIKLLSLVLALAMITAIAAGCGKADPAQSDPAAPQDDNMAQNKETVPVEFSIEGEPMQENYAVFSNDFLSIAYNDKFLKAEFSDDAEDIVDFESSGGVDVDMEIAYYIANDYASAASTEYSYESADADNVAVSELTDVTLNGYKAKYFSVINDDSCNEYYFIAYSGSAKSDVTYVTLKSDFPAAAAEAWIPRVQAMANTLTFK